jgi:hypothetical protein
MINDCERWEMHIDDDSSTLILSYPRICYKNCYVKAITQRTGSECNYIAECETEGEILKDVLTMMSVFTT